MPIRKGEHEVCQEGCHIWPLGIREEDYQVFRHYLGN